jgi:hypothetical protein
LTASRHAVLEPIEQWGSVDHSHRELALGDCCAGPVCVFTIEVLCVAPSTA